jgi:HAD superfamily hydrolase (TIGR01509 family)
LPGAVIFDMDGVLADTEPIHEIAIGDFLALHGKSLTGSEYTQFVGLGHRAVWTKLIAMFGLGMSVEECVTDYQPILVSRIVGVPPGPGVRDLVLALRAAGIPLGVASSSFRKVVEATLASIGLRDQFAAVVSGEEVGRGKPAPDIYLRAAGFLGVAPGRCVAIEDSRHGVQAARAAGMACLGLASRYTSPGQLGADRTVDSLADVGVEDIAALLWRPAT